jgi:hypothetical protein
MPLNKPYRIERLPLLRRLLFCANGAKAPQKYTLRSFYLENYAAYFHFYQSLAKTTVAVPSSL